MKTLTKKEFFETAVEMLFNYHCTYRESIEYALKAYSITRDDLKELCLNNKKLIRVV